MKNRTCWKDIEGKEIQAHGGCILLHEGVYYWYGENKDTQTTSGRVDFLGFSCYSSKNLTDWKFESVAFDPVGQEREELSAEAVGERPKVLYNTKTGKFVMWFHLDNKTYSFAKIGIAVSDSPVGPFIYQGYLWPQSHETPNGKDCRDLTLFQDDDGTVYLFCSTNWNSSMLVCKLNEEYTGLSGECKLVMVDQYREAPVVIHEKDRYYLFTSGCTGWKANAMLYAVAKSPMGIWRLIDNPCEGPDARDTFFGQTANAIKVNGQWHILLDHWNEQDLRTSGYSLLPISFDGERVTIPWKETVDFND